MRLMEDALPSPGSGFEEKLLVWLKKLAEKEVMTADVSLRGPGAVLKVRVDGQVVGELRWTGTVLEVVTLV